MPTPILRMRVRLLERFGAAPETPASVFWRSERIALVRYSDSRMQPLWEEIEWRAARRAPAPGFGARLGRGDGGVFEPAAITRDGEWLLGRRGGRYEAVARDGPWRQWSAPDSGRDLHWLPDGSGFVAVSGKALHTFTFAADAPRTIALPRAGVALGFLPTGELLLVSGGLPSPAPELIAVGSGVRRVGVLKLPRGSQAVRLVLSPRRDRVALDTGRSLWTCGIDGRAMQKVGDLARPSEHGRLAWLPSGERLSYWWDGGLYMLPV